VSECENFDRVLVLRRGVSSRTELPRSFAPAWLSIPAAFEVEQELSEFWSDGRWRTFRLENGRLVDA
jgi:hypothetical protein